MTHKTDLPTIEAKQGFIAVANAKCWKCEAAIAVICIFVHKGAIEGESQSDFTVSNITTVDDELRKRLKPIPFFREGHSRAAEISYLANHCFECGELQGDFLLHSEPGGAFFPETPDDLKSIDFVPIEGPVRLEGDIGMGSMTEAFAEWSRRQA